MNATTLTNREQKMVVALVKNEYSEGDPDAATYTWVVCRTASDKAVFGSLVKKGLAYSQQWSGDEACGLTDEGRAVYEQLTTF